MKGHFHSTNIVTPFFHPKMPKMLRTNFELKY